MCPHQRKSHSTAVIIALLGLAVTWSIPAQGAVHLVADTGDDGDRFGSSASELEDINGDGRWEFLAGSPLDQTAGLDAGSVSLWFGREALTVVPDRTFAGTSPEKFGFAVARIGDVNHDGNADWAVGAPGANVAGLETGRVYVFYGGSNPSATGDVVINGATGGDQFGYAVSAAGDFDGDGNDDFIVGAPYSDLRAQNAGAAYVIYGSPSGPSTNLANATVFAGEVADDNFGWSVSDAGNFLGGAADGVAVGAPLNNTHGGLDAGAVYVFEGKTAGANPDTTIDFVAGIGSSAKASSRFGFCVREIGSFDGDGYSDLAVGAPQCDESGLNAGRVEIFRGGTSPSVSAYRYVNGANASDHLGYSLARVHNVPNIGTSLDDVLLGAPFQDGTATDAGRAYLYAGGSSSQSSAANLTQIPVNPLVTGTSSGDNFGYATSSAGDFDGDGFWDYVVGAPGGNILSSATAGYCYLVDSSLLVVSNLLTRWEPGWNGDVARVDFSVAAETVTNLSVTRSVRTGGVETARSVIWDAPASLPGSCGGGVCLQVSAAGYRLEDPDAAGLLDTGSDLLYDLTVRLVDGETVSLGAQPGPDAQGIPVAQEAALVIEDLWPNPANPQVSISYRAPLGAAVSAQVLDLRGRVVSTLQAEPGTGGLQELTWEGREDSGVPAASGLYLVSIRTTVERQVRPVVLAR